MRISQTEYQGLVFRIRFLGQKIKIMRKFLLLVAVAFLTVIAVNRPNSAELEIDPAALTVKEDKSLPEYDDERLTSALKKELSSNKHWKNLIAAKKMAVTLVDMSDPEKPRLAAVNGDEMMYAASLPKIAILLGAADALEAGDLKETPEVLHDMRIMISKSNNQAASRMIDRVGMTRIAKVLTDPDILLYDEGNGGGLWVGKRYARAGNRNPDPLKGLSHAATTNQVARFYYLLERGQLISPERSAQMLEMLKDPELNHKFVNTLNLVAPNASIYRKSGSWSTFHSDSVMVFDDGWRRYILVALINDPNGESICRQIVTYAENALKATLPAQTVAK